MKIKEISEQYQTDWMNGLPLKGVIEMQDSEARFINGVIRELKPRKILEVGVVKNPFVAPVAVPVASAPVDSVSPLSDSVVIRRIQRLEKICYAGFAGIAGFLSASAIAILSTALWR